MAQFPYCAVISLIKGIYIVIPAFNYRCKREFKYYLLNASAAALLIPLIYLTTQSNYDIYYIILNYLGFNFFYVNKSAKAL